MFFRVSLNFRVAGGACFVEAMKMTRLCSGRAVEAYLVSNVSQAGGANAKITIRYEVHD